MITPQRHNISGRFFDFAAFKDVFTTRESRNPSSLLHSKEVRSRLWARAGERTRLDASMLGPCAPVPQEPGPFLSALYGCDDPRELEEDDAELEARMPRLRQLLSCGCMVEDEMCVEA
jgi:hypothetical protein